MSATDPARSQPTAREYSPEETYGYGSAGDGWLLFAVVMLGMVGLLNVIDGIAAVSNSKFFVNDAKFVFSGLNTLGWVLIAIGVAQALIALGVWSGVSGTRWAGVAIAAINAIAQILIISSYPFWALTLFALDVLVIYGLIVHGGSRRRA
jgi:hypothetical protein